MAFIMSWNEFLLSSVLISKESMKTLTVGLANYISSTHIDWGIIMALGTITTIPVIILFALVQKYFVEGMTAGNIVAGGVVGFGVDAATGAMTKYNENNQIAMSQGTSC